MNWTAVDTVDLFSETGIRVEVSTEAGWPTVVEVWRPAARLCQTFRADVYFPDWQAAAIGTPTAEDHAVLNRTRLYHRL